MGDVEIELGTRFGPFAGTVDPDLVRRYAAATNDTSATVTAGTAVPATFPVLLVFDAQYAAHSEVPRAVFESGRSGVHGEHDIVLHRPLVPGETLETWSEPWAVRNTRAGMRLVLHMEQFGQAGELAVEQWWTIFFAGNDALADVGPEPPDHTFPEAARAHPVASMVGHVDLDQPTRYAEVSNDWSGHHFDLEAARASGFDYLFAHGLCTMAFAQNAIVNELLKGDATKLKRLAVRFAKPVLMGEKLTTEGWEVESRDGVKTYGFQVKNQNGVTVISNGIAELVG